MRAIQYTAGDLIEGLSLLEVASRRAVLFGLEQRLPIERVIELTHPQLGQLQLTPLALRVIECTPRRANHVFWTERLNGVAVPLTGLAQDVWLAFQMTWSTLRSHYASMAWVDAESEADYFLRVARREGLL